MIEIKLSVCFNQITKDISQSKYLENNGFGFSAGDIESLKLAMKKIVQLNDKELIQMAEKSHNVGMSFTNKDWVSNLLSIIE